MLSVTAVLAVIICAINVINYQSIVSDADEKLSVLNEHNGDFPEFLPSGGVHTKIDDVFNYPEAKYENFFFTMIYKDGEFFDVDTEYCEMINRDEAINIANHTLHFTTKKGFFGDFGTTRIYRYLISENEEGTRMTFLDCTVSIENYYRFFALSIATAAGSLLLIFVMMLIFATRIISPISESYEKQKQFITNAGHDIKTPITVIDADREILEMEIGESEWLDDIKKQTKRLAKLTSDLIYLSRMEEGTEIRELSTFSISGVCADEADSFSALAMRKNLRIVTDIEDDLEINGSEGDVRKLLSILLDNAIKYAKEGTEITVKTVRHSRYATVIISNVAENMTEEQTKRMFDRFYRADGSRSSEGGFGIGLATAQAIVLSHEGKISADLSHSGILSISASFPIKYGSFSLSTGFVEKIVKNANNTLQNARIFKDKSADNETDILKKETEAIKNIGGNSSEKISEDAITQSSESTQNTQSNIANSEDPTKPKVDENVNFSGRSTTNIDRLM